MRRSIIYILYTQPPRDPRKRKTPGEAATPPPFLALATQVPDFGAVAVMGEYSNFVHSRKNIKFRPFARIPRS
jgi:hypothetical protein